MSVVTLGIVGCAQEKFTPTSEARARAAIRDEIRKTLATRVVSGACPMGGIDVWAIEEAKKLGVDTHEFAPVRHQWSGPGGFHERNMDIAHDSNYLANIVLDEYPPGFPEHKRFAVCYHCKTDTHIKSGGCWTMKYAKGLGVATKLIVIPQYEWVEC